MRPADIRNQTPYLQPNEKAMGLVEVELLTNDYQAIHRYQIVYVVRNDTVAAHITDLGHAIRFPNPPLNIVTLMEHSVDEVLDMAGEARERSDVRKRLGELQEESAKDKNIIKQYLENKDEAVKMVDNKSHFGPTLTKQRIGFPKKAIEDAKQGN